MPRRRPRARREQPPDHYRTLDVSPDATIADIKKSYRKLALQHHPDKVEPAQQEEARQLMARINWAKEVLLG